MAWDGTVKQKIQFIKKSDDGRRIIVFQNCQHEQISEWPLHDILKLHETVCFQCSKPHWDKISAIRESISFDDVVGKLKEGRTA